MAKVALGTVQFGLDYGMTNNVGKPAVESIKEVLEFAQRENITLLDTAYAYGSAENVLGHLLPGNDSWARIATKLPPLLETSDDTDLASKARVAFHTSLDRLQRTKVASLMVHRSSDLLSPQGEHVWALMNELKDDGKVGLIGASVYSPQEAEALLSKYPIEVIQLPANLYDGRFDKSGMLNQLKAAGVEVHVRSLYLQGILLTPPNDLPPRFEKLKVQHERLYRQFAKDGVLPATACLAAYLNHTDVDYIVIGCQNKWQIQRLVESVSAAESIGMDTSKALRCNFTIDDAAIINPALWN
ncbi:aldo/keto reductase [Pseudovibrio sp. JE062]|uniref:aldo/keto reductase n=1 Tax=Pseudovibrio sp. JE062 TaxID=439495 RepID=UPI000186F656|nr:aldo/keto reductase [Pseudovibrio sp. JE062]EEA93480.1 aldo/keto reductase family protein [Pseudovibrio sp. JE062]